MGKRVKAKHHTPHMPEGAHGHITSTHTGTFHGVAYGGGTVYLPATQVEPAEDEPAGSEEAAPSGADLSGAILGILRRRMR